MMKWVLYVIAAVAVLMGVVSAAGAKTVFHETASVVLLLIGTSSFGFAVIAGKLDSLGDRLRDDASLTGDDAVE